VSLIQKWYTVASLMLLPLPNENGSLIFSAFGNGPGVVVGGDVVTTVIGVDIGVAIVVGSGVVCWAP
jgi:hypothetical protein